MVLSLKICLQLFKGTDEKRSEKDLKGVSNDQWKLSEDRQIKKYKIKREKITGKVNGS